MQAHYNGKYCRNDTLQRKMTHYNGKYCGDDKKYKTTYTQTQETKNKKQIRKHQTPAQLTIDNWRKQKGRARTNKISKWHNRRAGKDNNNTKRPQKVIRTISRDQPAK